MNEKSRKCVWKVTKSNENVKVLTYFYHKKEGVVF